MKIARDTINIFCLLYVLFVPVELVLFSLQGKLAAFVFTDIISFTAHLILGKTLVQAGISSDSVALYTLVLILLIVAVFIATFSNFLTWYRQNKDTFLFICNRIFCYYLSLQLFIYGTDKIFKAQFYLPEPNTLYTPLGFISRDLLYWSTIGSSHAYSIFLGLAEVLAALLLIFRKTRIVGLLTAAILMINIVMVNFSFDISVKLHSTFLCFLAFLLLWPYGRSLFRFFILKEPTQITETKTALILSRGLRTGLKTFVVCIILFEAFYPFLKTKNYNDDLSARPLFHGAYEVKTDSTSFDSPPIKRFFIHRDGYLIFQNDKDEMKDYRLLVDTISHHFLLFDYNRQSFKISYEYFPKDSLLTLHYFYKNQSWPLLGKALNWKTLPLLKDQFHWTVEDVR